METKIKNVIIAITNRCNLHCKMCTIWKERSKTDLKADEIRKILDSKHLDEDVSLTLTGGEPFLSTEFDKIIGMIIEKRPHSLKTISTNGTMTEKIMSFLRKNKKRLPNLSISISFDGVNCHDVQRGKSKSKIMKTIKAIKKEFPDMRLKLKFTITPYNYKDIMPTYKFCKKIGVILKVKMSESADNYTNKLTPWKPVWTEGMKRSIKKDLKFLKSEMMSTDAKSADFITRTIGALDGIFHMKKCNAPYERIFVMPDGTVYSCIHMESIGNILDDDLDKIYNSKTAKDNRVKGSLNRCKGCVSFHGSG